MIRIKGSILINFILLFVLISAIITSLHWKFDAKALPLLICSITAILVIIIIYLELKNGTGDKGADDQPSSQEDAFTEFLYNTGWLLMLFGLILIAGFYAAILLFMLSYSIKKKFSWYNVVIFTSVCPVVVWFFFNQLFKVKLWVGFIPEIIPNILGGNILPPL